MPPTDAATALTLLGFTGLESEIYAFLLGESAATGYRIAQAIGKPVANTYKAIQSLQAKGAIVVEEGESRLCKAVPSDELLDRLGREYEKRRVAAKGTLAKIGNAGSDEKVYFLRAQAQVTQRARQMLEGATTVVLVSAPEALISELKDEIEGAAARGVSVFIKSDKAVSVAGVETYVPPNGEDLRPGILSIKLVTDGEQHLFGLLSPSSVEVMWSQSESLSLLHHEALAAEISLLIVGERLEDGAGPKRIAKALTQVPSALSTPAGSKIKK